MKVHSQFIPDDALEGSDIDVDTNNGVVTLNGTVASEAGRARAVAIAKATDGVKNVNDNLRCRAGGQHDGASRPRGGPQAKAGEDRRRKRGRDHGPGDHRRLDQVEDLTRSTSPRTRWTTATSTSTSSKGAVALNGVVRTAAAKARAAAIAKATDGVKGVKNNLKVDPSVK